MLHYLFGLHLDGCFAPSQWQGIGKSVCGPTSFLNELETSLGLPPLETPPLERLLIFQKSISEVLTEDDFYAKSFEEDPLATTRLILSWRDELHEAGWNTQIEPENAPIRIQSLLRIEGTFVKSGVANHCPAGRVQAILDEINICGLPKIDQLTVTDPEECLPICWVNLLKTLGAQFKEPTPQEAIACNKTLLGHLQSTMTCGSDKTHPKDQSVKIITAATQEEAAQALACEMASTPTTNSTIIADASEQAKLNQFLQKQDVACCPASEETGVALLQLPLLYIQTRFDPFDPQASLEFLLHSVSPVPSLLRRSITKAINQTPGYGLHWNEALDQTIEWKESEPKTQTKLKQAYTQWIERSDLLSDTPEGHELAKLLQPLLKWIAQIATVKTNHQEPDAAAWSSAHHSISSLASILASSDQLTQSTLKRLMAEWLSSAKLSLKSAGGVGAARNVTSPAQLLESNEHIIWWRPTQTIPNRSPWSAEELQWFKQVNISIIDHNVQALAMEQVATRAILMAGKSLTIYHVTRSGGKTTAQAGILTRIAACCGEDIVDTAKNHITTKSIAIRPLPSKRRWWRFREPQLFPPRDEESFSSVSKVIDTPFIWVLDYHTKLKAGPIFNYRVKDSPLRSGSILHSLAEKLFDPANAIDFLSISETELHDKIEHILWTIFPTEASHYLVHGYESARTNLTHNAKKTFWALIKILRDADIIEVTMEKSIDPIPFIGGMIAGRIDLIARRSDGESAVIDLKLGGKTKRANELATNRHLQLAVYGKLMLDSQNIEAATAFYILSNGGSLLTRNEVFFPETKAITPKKDTPHGDWLDCWNEFEDVYRWRRDQLDRGKVEVPIPDTDPNEDAKEAPPLSRWEPPKEASQYSAYDALTGWSPNA